MLFAPGLAEEHEGFPAGKYPALAKVESKNFWFRSRNKLIVRVLNRHFGNQKSFLEIGCGTGFVLSGVAAAFPEARMSASEIDLAGLPFVRQRVARAEIFQVDARQIPYQQEFDVIGAFDVIEHIEEDEKVLNQIYNACKPGGGVVITVPQHPWLWSPIDTLSCHKRRYTKKELVRKIKRAGFEIVETISFVSLLLPLMLVSRLRTVSEKDLDPMRELSLPKFLNRMFCWIMDLERVLIQAGLRLPVGGSLLCVGKKI
ncbi:MAG: class I SAM-dependent methyltransferase [Nitrospinaceae bacterium]